MSSTKPTRNNSVLAPKMISDNLVIGTKRKNAPTVARNIAAPPSIAVGEGELHQQLHTYSQQKGIADRVIFTGFRNDVPAILPQLNVFLITSTTEGLGTSILDAFVCESSVKLADVAHEAIF